MAPPKPPWKVFPMTSSVKLFQGPLMQPVTDLSSYPIHDEHDLSKGTTVVTGGAGLIGSATIWGINNQNLQNIWLVDWVEENSKKEKNIENLKYQRLVDARNLEILSPKKTQTYPMSKPLST
jgi:hypothetical protein